MFRRTPPTWPTPPFSELKKRTRILIVDDQDAPYADRFRRDGYALDHWLDIDELAKLDDGQFDIIFLDLHGVGTQLSSQGGLGVLRYLRHRHPTQLVVAYSNAKWSLGDQGFIKLADAALAKSANYTDFKMVVDDLIAKRFSNGFFVSRLQEEFGTERISRGDLERALVYAAKHNDAGRIGSLARKVRLSGDQIDRVLKIAQIALQTYAELHKT